MKKNELKELTVKKMQEFNFSEKLIDEFQNDNIFVTTDNGLEEVSGIAKAYKEAIEFFMEGIVYHIINRKTEFGDSWYMLFNSEKNGCKAYAYYPESPLNSGEVTEQIIREVRNNG